MSTLTTFIKTRPLSDAEFRSLLVGAVVYVRPLNGGHAAFSADGTHIATMVHYDCLIGACYENNFMPLRVH